MNTINYTPLPQMMRMILEYMTPLILINVIFVILAMMYYFASVADESRYNEPVLMFFAKLHIAGAIFVDIYLLIIKPLM